MNTARWTTAIDLVTNDFKNTFGHLAKEELNKKPNASVWSIAQNIHHLIIINQTYYPIFEALRNGTYRTPFIGKIPMFVNLFGKFILKSVQPDRSKKMKTLKIWEPSASDLPADILLKFVEHQQVLKKQIESCAVFLDADRVINSPANTNIVYKLKTAFDIIVTHERRHFEQAKELLNSSK